MVPEQWRQPTRDFNDWQDAAQGPCYLVVITTEIDGWHFRVDTGLNRLSH